MDQEGSTRAMEYKCQALDRPIRKKRRTPVRVDALAVCVSLSLFSSPSGVSIRCTALAGPRLFGRKVHGRQGESSTLHERRRRILYHPLELYVESVVSQNGGQLFLLFCEFEHHSTE